VTDQSASGEEENVAPTQETDGPPEAPLNERWIGLLLVVSEVVWLSGLGYALSLIL
jgi:hypothetical protein